MKSTVSPITLRTSSDRATTLLRGGRSRHCLARRRPIDVLVASAAISQLQHLNQLHPQ